jgi:hypothetical protein
MQDRHAGRDPRHIDIGGAQPIREGNEKFARIGSPARIRHQPADDRVGLIAIERLHHGTCPAPKA